jgi:transposase
LKARTKAAVDRRVKKEFDSLEVAAKKLRKVSFACIPDLKAAWHKVFAKAHFHIPGEIEVRTEAKQRGRGRPRAGQEGPHCYFPDSGRIRRDVSEARRAVLEGACFVIATNDLREATSPEEILNVYMKEQQGFERGFRFLKV